MASYRLLGSATVPLKNLVRSKNNSLKIEVGLLDGEQRPTLVSYHPGMIAFPLSSVGEPFSFYVCEGYCYYLYSTVLSVVSFSNRPIRLTHTKTVHTKTIVNANASKRKLFYAFRPSVHTKTMKTLTVNA